MPVSRIEVLPEPGAATDDRRLRRIGAFTVLLIFGGFGAWAVLAPLGSAALGPGLIAVENYRKTIQHLEGGIVKSIDVRDGDTVMKDQVLLTLEDTQPRAQSEVIRGQLFIALAREARLVAQRDESREIRFPPELLHHEKDARVEDAIRVQEQTFRVRRQAHEGEIALYQRQIEQLHAKARGLSAQKESRDRLVTSYRGELQDFAALLDQGYVERQKVREFERRLAEGEGQRGELMAELAATELQISETRLKIVQLQKEVQREVAKELSEVQADLFALREKQQSLEDMVTRTVIRAPEAGMVLDLAVHTLGAVIRSGERILDIVPQDEKLIVEAKISPQDIDRVHVGQSAEVRFTAFKTRDTPRIDGTLVTLSADRLMEEAGGAKVPFYLARVEVTPTGLQELTRHQLRLMPGMPAEVLINTGERTLFGYLMDPLRNTLARAFIED